MECCRHRALVSAFAAVAVVWSALPADGSRAAAALASVHVSLDGLGDPAFPEGGG